MAKGQVKKRTNVRNINMAKWQVNKRTKGKWNRVMRSWDGEPKEKWTRVIETIKKIIITLFIKLDISSITIMTVLKITTNIVILIIFTTR